MKHINNPFVGWILNGVFFILVITSAPALLNGQSKSKASLSPEQIYKISAKSIVTITAANTDGSISQGSGAVFAENVIVTNTHVIKNAKSIIISQGNKMWKTNMVHIAENLDIAFLRVSDLNLKCLQKTILQIKPGNKVYTIGNPRGLELSLSDGLISSIRNYDDHNYYQITAPISPGSSGGALIDSTGKLIGITTFKLLGGENLNFAIPISEISYEYRNVRFSPLETINSAVLRKNESKEDLSSYISMNTQYVAQPFILTNNDRQFAMGNNIKLQFSPDYRYMIVTSSGNYFDALGKRINIGDSEIKIPMKDVVLKVEKIEVTYTNSAPEGYYDLSAETKNGQKTIVLNHDGVAYNNKAILMWSRDREGLYKMLSAINKIQDQLD